MLVCLVGPSAVGKTTLENELTKRGIAAKLISTTDRAIRPNEPNDSYYFVSKEEFDKIDFSEKTEYAGNRYGLSMAELERTYDETKDFVFVCEVNGMKQMHDFTKVPMVSIFLNAEDEALIRRLELRGTDDIHKRIARFPEDRASEQHCLYTVRNEDLKLEDAIQQIQKIMEQHRGGHKV